MNRGKTVIKVEVTYRAEEGGHYFGDGVYRDNPVTGGANFIPCKVQKYRPGSFTRQEEVCSICGEHVCGEQVDAIHVCLWDGVLMLPISRR
ncbi:MAG: hypothetical protein DDT33_01674 [Firmicutes bacterium]|nr:hypothetical protein [Bacillota bacterium]